MGVGGGGFWELLKPLARYEDFEFLRDKKVAVDLSYWIVQHETALRGSARNPHIRLTFFRTINLFSKFGAFPVFVVDGDPSPLKTKARINRFFRMSGIDTSDLPKPDGNIVARNGGFVKCVQECVELLERLGMPVLKASSEAEALCAQLNSDGHVDACITADSDAFLFGAKCVIKDLKPNHKGSCIECYHMSDIEANLGLSRKHLVAIALLVGNDYDLKGIQGIGFSNAVRFVKLFHENDILDRLHEVGKKDPKLVFRGLKNPDTEATDTETSLSKRQPNHYCSHCGHPGTKDAHCKGACEYCNGNGVEGCIQKPMGFKCACPSCCEMLRRKNNKKEENWKIKICKLIGAEDTFPNQEIVEMFLASNNDYFSENTGPAISWSEPDSGCLIDFLSYYQNWKPSYIRERLLPLLSTFFLRETASNHSCDLLLLDQYKFDSIHRVKVRNGVQSYVVKWKRAWIEPRHRIDEAQVRTSHDGRDKKSSGPSEVCGQLGGGSVIRQTDPDAMTGESNEQEKKSFGTDELMDMLDDAADIAKFVGEDGSCYIITDENIGLVKSAFPEKVDQFLKELEAKKSKSRVRKSPPDQGTPQRSITEYFRSTKRLSSAMPDQITPIKDAGIVSPTRNADKRTVSPAARLSKSARRRLLFN